MNSNDNLVFELLQEKDVAATHACLLDVYPDREPTCISGGLTAQVLNKWACEYTRIAAQEGMSFICKDLNTNRVVAFVLNFDFATENNISDPEYDDTKYVAVDALIEGMIDEYSEKYQPVLSNQPGMLVHVGNMGVRAEYEGRGITTKLLQLTIDLVQREKKYRGIVAEAASPISLHMFRDKFGFKVLFGHEYAEFEVKGLGKPFANVAHFGGCYFVEKLFDDNDKNNNTYTNGSNS